MKKRNIIACSISILIVIGFIGIAIFGIKEETFTENGITYALTIDGVKQNSFPSKGMYRVDTECVNATCKWDYDAWKLYIEDITGDISCDISFTTINKTNFNDYIIGLSETAQGKGKLVHETFYNDSEILVDAGYRYEGQDPNNYVWFNGEPWRIIGVMNNESHGQNGLNLVKLIRLNTLHSMSWTDKNNCRNDYKNSNIYSLLNDAYYNKKNANDDKNCTLWNNQKVSCDYRRVGIDNRFKNMIKNVFWYLGGVSTETTDDNYYLANVNKYYSFERNSELVYDSNPSVVEGNIGLMYASDYGFAMLPEDCSRTTFLQAYKNKECLTNNWIYTGIVEWTITPYNNSQYYAVFAGDESSDGSTTYGYEIRPVLYLNENVYVLDGDGSYNDPYIIGMDET